MPGARGDALEWALALARAPSERLVLRQRPLPEGIESLLQIAAGHGGDVLSDAVSRTGETEESVVDAVRFFLREVLFHSGADAYRVLGLARDASNDRAKAHHRWLQQWLHPDRHTSDWDAIFAGRVNAAWSQLRTANRRRAYDAEHPDAPWPAFGSSQAPSVARTAGWSHPRPAPTPRARWQRRAPVLALLAACAGLGLLALRDLARDEGLALAAADTAAKKNGSMKASSGAVDVLENLRLPAKETPPVAAVSSTTKSRKYRRAVPPGVVGLPGRREPLPARASPLVLEGTLAAPPTPRTAPRQTASPPIPKASRMVAVEPAKPIAKTIAATGTAATPKLDPPPLLAVALAPSSASESQSASAPTPTAAPIVRPAAGLSPSSAALSPPPAAAHVAVPAPAVSAERVRQVEQAGSRLLAYMNGRSAAVPPIWGSLAAQQGAGRLREELLTGGKVAFAAPEWRVGTQDAQLQVELRYPDGRQGRLAAGLAWREQRWLVNHLSMERDW